MSRREVMIAWTRVVVVVDMERGIPRVPPVLLQPIFSLNPVTRMCSRICSTWKLVHTLGLGGSLLFQEAFSRQCQFSEFFQKLSLSSVSFISCRPFVSLPLCFPSCSSLLLESLCSFSVFKFCEVQASNTTSSSSLSRFFNLI